MGVLGALLLPLALPAGASAAPQPDQVVAEVSEPLSVGISGPVLAYTRRVGTRGVQVVVDDGGPSTKRLSAGRGEGPVDVGRDRRGRPVVVYARCGKRCDLVAFRPSAGRSRVVVRGVRARDVTVGRGRIFWADGRTVRSRSLEGGPVRSEAVAKGVSAAEIDTDGLTLAVVGDGPTDRGDGSTALSVTRPGSGRARIRFEQVPGEEFWALRGPVVTRTGVTTLLEMGTNKIATNEIASSFAEFRAGGRGLRERSTGGMGVTAWDADGDAMVLVAAPSGAGCAVGESKAEGIVLDAPCRIVRAQVGGERVLPPDIVIVRGTAGAFATVRQAEKLSGDLPGERPLAGVAVEVRHGAEVRARLVTDAQGRVTLPPPEPGGLAVVAETTPRSYAYYGG